MMQNTKILPPYIRLFHSCNIIQNKTKDKLLPYIRLARSRIFGINQSHTSFHHHTFVTFSNAKQSYNEWLLVLRCQNILKTRLRLVGGSAPRPLLSFTQSSMKCVRNQTGINSDIKEKQSDSIG